MDNTSVHDRVGVPGLGPTLRRLRHQHGFTQRDLLKRLHLASHSAIVAYESGRRLPAPSVVAAYERVFEVPAGDLMRLRERELVRRAEADDTCPRTAATPLETVPHSLPAGIGHFAGRRAELDELGRTWSARSDDRAAIAVVNGPAGIGKSALALHWAQRVRRAFPDGNLYVDLRDGVPQGNPGTRRVLTLFLTSLGVAPGSPAGLLAELVTRYRTASAGRRLLVVIDNAENTNQVRPLLPATRDSMVLITSRHRLSDLHAREGGTSIALGAFPADVAHQLLRRLLGRAADPAQIDALAKACGYHPMSLRAAAEWLACDPSRTLPELIAWVLDHDGVACCPFSSDGCR